MSYIIGNACVGCIDMGCLNVCPVDCIHGPIKTNDIGEGARGLSDEEKQGKQLYINPDDCINCGACEPECPVEAIYHSEKDAIAAGEEAAVHKNYEFFGLKFN